jgi:hypothetical protein
METIFLLRLEKEGKRILYSLLFVTSMQYGATPQHNRFVQYRVPPPTQRIPGHRVKECS